MITVYSSEKVLFKDQKFVPISSRQTLGQIAVCITAQRLQDKTHSVTAK